MPGACNTAADALSRNNAPLFTLMFPQVHQVQVPQVVQDLLVSVTPNWGSRDWTSLFMTSWIGASPTLPEQSTSQDEAIPQILSGSDQPPLPLYEHILCRFTAVMSQTVSWKTIRVYLSALRSSRSEQACLTLP